MSKCTVFFISTSATLAMITLRPRTRTRERVGPRLMIVQGVLFACLSFGLSTMEQTVGRPVLFVVCSGSLAVVLLAAGFGIAIHALGMRDFSIPGVIALQKAVESESLGGLDEASHRREICVNLAKAINENLHRDQQKKLWARGLRSTTLAGFICTSIFIGLVICGNAYHKITSYSQREGITMGQDEPTNDAQATSDDQTENQSAVVQPEKPRPSLIEPSATVQKSKNPNDNTGFERRGNGG